MAGRAAANRLDWLDRAGESGWQAARRSTSLSDGRLEEQPLLVQRERLVAEIREEEVREASALNLLNQQLAVAEAEASERQEALAVEEVKCQTAEDRLTHIGASGEQAALVAALASMVRGLASDAAEEMELSELGLIKQQLQAELFEAKEELRAARDAKASLSLARATAEKRRLDQLVDAIRQGSQESQALQANQQMAHAHVKALEAMVSSSLSRIAGREAALQEHFQQLQQYEGVAKELQGHMEAAELRLSSSTAELQLQEAATAMPQLIAPAIAEQQLQHAQLESAVRQLGIEAVTLQGELHDCRGAGGAVDELLAKAKMLREECRTAELAARRSSLLPAALEAELARTTTARLDQQRRQSELQASEGLALAATQQLQAEASRRKLELQAELAAAARDGQRRSLEGTQATRARLQAREKELWAELARHETACERLRSEARERDAQFSGITGSLQDEIDALRARSIEAAELRTRLHGHSSQWSSLASIPGLSASPGLHQGAGAAAVSAAAAAATAAAAGFSSLGHGSGGSSLASPGLSGILGSLQAAFRPSPLADPGQSMTEPPGNQAPLQRGRRRHNLPSSGSEASLLPGSWPQPSAARGTPLPRARQPPISAPMAAEPLPQCAQERLALRGSPPPQAGFGTPGLRSPWSTGGPGPELRPSAANTPAPRASPLGHSGSADSNLFRTHTLGLSALAMERSSLLGRSPPASYQAPAMPAPAVAAAGTLDPGWAEAEAVARGGMQRRGRTPAPELPQSAPREVLPLSSTSMGTPGSATCPAAALARHATAEAARSRTPSPPRARLTLSTINQAESEILAVAERLADAPERKSAFQARVAELRGVLGPPPDDLEEELAATNGRAARVLRSRGGSLSAIAASPGLGGTRSSHPRLPLR